MLETTRKQSVKIPLGQLVGAECAYKSWATVIPIMDNANEVLRYARKVRSSAVSYC